MMINANGIQTNQTQRQLVLNTPTPSGDLETQAMTEVLKNAKQRRADARAQEQGARQDRVDRMKASVAKMRAAANATIAGAIVNGAAGVGAALVQFGKAKAQTKLPAGKEITANFDGGTTLCGVVQGLPVGQLAGSHLETDRRELELGAERASDRADAARRVADDTHQSVGNVLSRIEKLNETRQRAMSHAVRV